MQMSSQKFHGFQARMRNSLTKRQVQSLLTQETQTGMHSSVSSSRLDRSKRHSVNSAQLHYTIMLPDQVVQTPNTNVPVKKMFSWAKSGIGFTEVSPHKPRPVSINRLQNYMHQDMHKKRPSLAIQTEHSQLSKVSQMSYKPEVVRETSESRLEWDSRYIEPLDSPIRKTAEQTYKSMRISANIKVTDSTAKKTKAAPEQAGPSKETQGRKVVITKASDRPEIKPSPLKTPAERMTIRKLLSEHPQPDPADLQAQFDQIQRMFKNQQIKNKELQQQLIVQTEKANSVSQITVQKEKRCAECQTKNRTIDELLEIVQTERQKNESHVCKQDPCKECPLRILEIKKLKACVQNERLIRESHVCRQEPCLDCPLKSDTISELQEQLRAISERSGNEQAQANLSVVRDLQEQVRSLTQELEAAKQQLERPQTHEHAISQKLDDMHNILAEQENTLFVEQESMVTVDQDLHAQLKSEQQLRQKLQKAFDELPNTSELEAQLKEAVEHIAALEATLEEWEGERLTFEQRVDALEQENQLLTQHAEEIEQTLEAAVSKEQDFESQTQLMQAKLETAENKLRELLDQKYASDSQNTTARLVEVKQELQLANTIKENLEREAKEKDDAIIKLKAEAEEMLKLIQTQEDQISRTDKTQDLLTQRLQQLQSQLKDQAATEKAIEARYVKQKNTCATQTTLIALIDEEVQTSPLKSNFKLTQTELEVTEVSSQTEEVQLAITEKIGLWTEDRNPLFTKRPEPVSDDQDEYGGEEGDTDVQAMRDLIAAKKAGKGGKKVPMLDLDAIGSASDINEEEIGRTLYERDSSVSKEDLETYFDREKEHANVFYALAVKFGLSIYQLPQKVADVREKRQKDKANYQIHVEQMRQDSIKLKGPERDRDDYESQPSIASADKTKDEAYNATQHDKDMFIRYLVEQLTSHKPEENVIQICEQQAEEIEALQSQVEMLSQKEEQASQQRKEMERKLADLQESARQAAESAAQVADLQETIDMLKSDANSMEQELRDQFKADLKDAVKETESKLKQKTQEAERLSKELKSLEQAKSTLSEEQLSEIKNKHESELSELREEFQRKDEQINLLLEENDKLVKAEQDEAAKRESNSEIVQQLEQKDKLIHQFEEYVASQNESLRRSLDVLKSQLGQKATELRSLQQTLEAQEPTFHGTLLQRELEEMMVLLKHDQKQLEDEIKKGVSLLASKEQELDAALRSKKESSAEISAMEERIVELTTKLNDMNALSVAKRDVESKLEAANQEIAEQKDQLYAADSKCQALEATVEQLQGTVNKQEGEVRMMRELQSTQTVNQGEALQKVQGMVQELALKNDQLVKENQEAAVREKEAKEQIAAQIEQMNVLTEKLKVIEDQTQNLQNASDKQLTDLTARITSEEERNQQAMDTIQEKVQVISNLELKLQAQTSAVDSLKLQLTNVQSELTAVQQSSTDAQVATSDSLRQMTDLNQSLTQEIESIKTAHQQDRVELQTVSAQLQQKEAEHAASLQSVQEECQTQKAKIDELTASNQSMSETHAAALSSHNSTLEAQEKTIQQLQLDLSDSKTQLDQKSTELEAAMADLAQIKKNINQLAEKQAQKLVKQGSKLNTEIETLKSTMKKQEDAMTDKLGRQTALLLQKEQELDKLRKQLQTALSQGGQAELTAKVAQLEQDKQLKSTLIEQLSQELAKLPTKAINEETDQLRMKLAEKEKEIEVIKSQTDGSNQQEKVSQLEKDLEAQIQSHKEDKSTLEAEIRRGLDAVASKERELQEASQQHQSDVEVHTQKLSSLRNDFEKQAELLQQTKAQLDSTHSEVLNLRQVIATSQQSESDQLQSIQTLKSELEKATIALQSKEQEHANYLKEVKDKCSSRDLRITELTALNTSMEEQQTEARTLIASLNTQITSIEAKLNHSNMNAQNLSQQLAELTSQLSSKETQLKQTEIDLQNKLQSQQSLIGIGKMKQEQIEAELASLKLQAAQQTERQLQSENDHQAKQRLLQDKLASLGSELESQKSKVSKFEEEYAKAMGQLTQRADEIDSMRKQLQLAQVQNQQSASQVQEQMKKLAQQEQEKQMKAMVFESLNQEIESLKKLPVTVKELTAKVANYEQEKQVKNMMIDQMSQEMAKLQNEVKIKANQEKQLQETVKMLSMQMAQMATAAAMKK